jgi:arylsulfatase A-like enzyme
VLALAAVLAVVLVVLEQTPIDAFRASRALVFSKLVAHSRRLSDVDEDGYAAVLGGRDCAAFDPRRSPGALERPENGVDEDCSGKDERWPVAPPAPRPGAPGSGNHNVLFISVDTLRADHLGTYGYPRPTSPNIDRFASEAVVFLRAFSQASKTWDSVPSFLTGLYPSNLPRDYRHRRVQKKPYFAYYLKDDVGLIAEAFAARGYSTSAIVSVALLRTQGMDRGFQLFKRSRSPTRAAQKQLKKLRPPFMLWLHYNSPHAPYKKRRGHDFGDEPIDRYDSEIAYEDDQIHSVLATLAARGLADSTIVVLTSDHGEEFGEHGGFSHTRKHYRELLHVPLIVKVPGVAPARVEDVVELVDIVPTLHELCALPPPRTRLDGQSLLATLEGPRPAGLGGAYAEDVHHTLHVSRRALFDGRFRLIDDRGQDREELYDVDEDPLERRDIAAERPEIVQRLRERIAVRALRSRSPRR